MGNLFRSTDNTHEDDARNLCAIGLREPLSLYFVLDGPSLIHSFPIGLARSVLLLHVWRTRHHLVP